MSSPIADLSYRGYEGSLESPTRRWWVIARMGIRQAFKKKSYWFFMALAGWYYLVMMTIIFFIEQAASNSPQGDEMFARVIERIVWKDQFLHGFSFAQLIFIFVVLLLGAGAIANDNRANALLVYLSKPCSKLDYLIGKWMGIFLPLLLVMVVPSLVFFMLGALSYRPYGFLSSDPWILPKMLLAMTLAAAFQSSLVVGVSSMFNQGRIAGVTYAALYFLTNFFTQLMAISWVQATRPRGSGLGGAADAIPTLFYASIDGLQIGAFKAILGTNGSPYFAIPSELPSVPAPNILIVVIPMVLLSALFLLIAWTRVRAVEVVGMIELNQASRWYGQVIGVNDVTCTIGPGVTALLGQTGAGKSTMMRLITGQLRPTTGTVRVSGMDPFANPEVYRLLGYCPEIDNFYEGMTGRKFVELLARMSGFSAADAKQRTQEVITRVGMADRCDRPIKGYSKGMRQRIKLAQAMLHEPKLILLDEPLNGLDPIGRREFIDLLAELADEGKTILVSSHILFEVEQMTRSILLLHRGRLLATGDLRVIRELIDKHPHRIRIETDHPREVAARLIALPYVLSVEMDPAGGAIELRTREPDMFYSQIPGLVVDDGMKIHGMTSPDNNLEAVFRYLVGV